MDPGGGVLMVGMGLLGQRGRRTGGARGRARARGPKARGQIGGGITSALTLLGAVSYTSLPRAAVRIASRDLY